MRRGLMAIGAAALMMGPAAAHAPAEVLTIGRSVEGREIRAVSIGDPGADRTALVVGVIHGDETAGLRITRRLKRRYRDLGGVELWVVDSANPDGLAAGMRKNSRGVDLNRNFPHRWSGGVPRSSGYYPGPAPLSEPESRAMKAFIERIRPDVSIWYHQPWNGVLGCSRRSRVRALYARIARMRLLCRGVGLPGTAIGWQNHRFGKEAFVVEFGPGGLSGAEVRRHARAAATVARPSR